MTVRERRVLVIGGLLTGVILLIGKISPRATDQFRRLRDEVASRRALLTQAQARLRETDALAAEVARIRGRFVALAPALLPGPDGIAAAESLEGLVRVAARDKVKVDPVEYVTDSTRAGRLERVSVRIGFESDLSGLTWMVTRLETGVKTLHVRDLRILATDPTSEEGPEVLRGELTVEGWLMPETEEPELEPSNQTETGPTS